MWLERAVSPRSHDDHLLQAQVTQSKTVDTQEEIFVLCQVSQLRKPQMTMDINIRVYKSCTLQCGIEGEIKCCKPLSNTLSCPTTCVMLTEYGTLCGGSILHSTLYMYTRDSSPT